MAWYNYNYTVITFSIRATQLSDHLLSLNVLISMRAPVLNKAAYILFIYLYLFFNKWMNKQNFD